MKALPQPGSGCSAQLAGVAAGFPGLGDTAQNLPNQIDRKMENWLELTFSSFSPSSTGAAALARPRLCRGAAVRPRCTSLPKLAKHEMSDHLRSPLAGLGCRVACTTFEFAQKKDARPVGGRGISAFSSHFFHHSVVSSQQEAKHIVSNRLAGVSFRASHSLGGESGD